VLFTSRFSEIANRESKGSKQLKLNNPSVKAHYKLELANRFEILADSSNIKMILIMKMM